MLPPFGSKMLHATDASLTPPLTVALNCCERPVNVDSDGGEIVTATTWTESRACLVTDPSVALIRTSVVLVTAFVLIWNVAWTRPGGTVTVLLVTFTNVTADGDEDDSVMFAPAPVGGKSSVIVAVTVAPAITAGASMVKFTSADGGNASCRKNQLSKSLTRRPLPDGNRRSIRGEASERAPF